MEQVTKTWWESRTNWLQIITIIFAIGTQFDWWPKNVTQEDVLGIVMALVAIITIILRLRTSAPIKTTGPIVAAAKTGMKGK